MGIKEINMIINKSIGELKPYFNNAKKHNGKQIKQVAESIKRFGFVQPIVIDKNNEIVIGHCRFEASKLLGIKMVPCILVDKLSDDEVKALRLADNKLNESDWDLDLVNVELDLLPIELVEITGFSGLDDIDFDSIESNENREKTFKEMEVNCPDCGGVFKIKI